MSRKAKRGRGKEQEAVDDLLHTLLHDGGASGSPVAIDAPGTLADASLTNVDRLLDRVGTRRKQAEERRAAAEVTQGGRKRKQTGLDPLFLQNGSGRALRRRTAVSSDPACGAPAQTAHNLEHGEKQRADDPPNGLLSGNGLEKGNGFGVGLKSGNKSELGHLTGESAIKREPDGSFEVEDELGDGVEGGNGFRKPLKGDATEEGGSLLSIEQTLFLEERVTVKGGALETEEEHWEEGFGHAAPSSTGPSGLAFASWSGQVAIETGDEEEGLGKPRAKPALRRATARDKEFAALVHKAHLLCLLARGMRFDGASEDPLLQASLLSCTPEALGSLSQKGDVIKGPELAPLVEWFQERFRILEGAEGRNGNEGVELSGWESDAERLQRVLEKRGGTAEELTALFVALCRALGLTTRYVSVLDVTPLKPDAASLGSSLNWDPDVEEEGSLIPYARGGPALAQMLRQLVPPEKTICATGLQSFKAPVQNGLKQFATGHANGIGGKGEEVKSNEGTGKKGAGWNGSAKVVDAGASKGGKGKGSAKGGGGELGQKKGGRGKKRVKEEEEIGGQGGVVKLEDLTEEEQLAQAIAASLAEEIVDSKGSSNGKRRKKGVKEEGGLAKEESAAERRRKGDAELEMQLQVAMAATAIEAAIKLPSTPETPSALVRLAKGEAPLRGLKKVSDGKGFGADAGAVWSRRRGPSLHWAEVYCGGGKEGGRWVHVDPVRGVVDAPGGVEAAAAGGKQPLRYVLAFAGGGAKDITRRYVSRWSVVMPLRIDPDWWEETLQPLRRLEAAATSGRPLAQLPVTSPGFKEGLRNPPESPSSSNASPSVKTLESGVTTLDTAAGGGRAAGVGTLDGVKAGSSSKKTSPKVAVHDERLNGVFTPAEDDRAAREDVEMETRTLTEPLPTNQQAYKSHHLYALERWLTKYQVLHPKGPILGYCAGQPVYPRTSVQVLHTADRWLREGRKVQRGSLPVKVLRTSKLASASEAAEQAALGEEGEEEGATSALFGRWQTDAWRPPPARNGKVPRNERGQVDVWDESFLPKGTVHLRYPRILQVTRMLKVDYAPAMVGFEVRGGRSVPKFDGIVICKEYESQVLDVYLEEEQRLHARELRKREQEAAQRWRQLLKAVALRQRLRTTYEHNPSPAPPANPPPASGNTPAPQSTSDEPADRPDPGTAEERPKRAPKGRPEVDEQHEHSFPEEDQSYDSDTGVRKKRCPCGFVLSVEEM